MIKKILICILCFMLSLNMAFAASLGENPPKQPMILDAILTPNVTIQGSATGITLTVSTLNCVGKNLVAQMVDLDGKPMAGIDPVAKVVENDGGVVMTLASSNLIAGYYKVMVKINEFYLVYYSNLIKVDGASNSPSIQSSATSENISRISTAVTGITLSESLIRLKVGQSSALSVQFTPSDVFDKGIEWRSSNPAAVEVDSAGKITAKSVGTSTIIATSVNGKKEAICTVEVLTNLVEVSSVVLNKQSATMEIGASLVLTAVVNPSNATDQAVQWISSNTTVATVVNGTIVARQAGTAVITASCGTKHGIATITVNPAANNNTTPPPSGGGTNTPPPSGGSTTGGTIGGGMPIGPAPIGGAVAAPVVPVTKKPQGTGVMINGLTDVIVKNSYDVDKKMSTTEIDKATWSKNQNLSKVLTVALPAEDKAKTYRLLLPSEAFLSGIKDNKIHVKTAIAEVMAPTNMFSASDLTEQSPVALVIGLADQTNYKEAAQKAIGDRPVISVTAQLGAKTKAWENNDSSVQIGIKYKPSIYEMNSPQFIGICYVSPEGTLIKMPSAKYNQTTGLVTFNTSHFSDYAVVFTKPEIVDLAKANWAKNQIELLVAKGIASSNEKSEFFPTQQITRADYLDMLIKALDLNVSFESNFSDVSKEKSYFTSLGIAKKLGITSGSGSNLFKPDQPITREEMMTLTVKALRMASKLNAKGDLQSLKAFKDANQVSGYAAESVSALIKDGLISGSNQKINPKGLTTRAEAAALIYKIYSRP